MAGVRAWLLMGLYRHGDNTRRLARREVASLPRVHILKINWACLPPSLLAGFVPLPVVVPSTLQSGEVSLQSFSPVHANESGKSRRKHSSSRNRRPHSKGRNL